MENTSFDDVYTGPSPVAPTMGYDLIPRVVLPSMAAAIPVAFVLGALGMKKLMHVKVPKLRTPKGSWWNRSPKLKVPR